MIMAAVLFELAALAPAAGACVPLSSERIRAGDMARAVAAFADLSPELVLGYAPAGGQRRLEAAEMARLARRYGLAVQPGAEVCFVRRVEVLTGDRVAGALRAALPGARIEVLDFSRQPIPHGDLHFDIAGLQTHSAGFPFFSGAGVCASRGRAISRFGPRLGSQWQGCARSPRRRSRRAVRSNVPICARNPIKGPPGLPGISQIVGRAPRRTIPAGTVSRPVAGRARRCLARRAGARRGALRADAADARRGGASVRPARRDRGGAQSGERQDFARHRGGPRPGLLLAAGPVENVRP